MKSKLPLVLVVLLALAIVLPAAQAAVLRIVVVVPDNLESYVKEIEKGQALNKKLGSTAIIRVWRARFAGDSAGSVVVSLEYPDLATLAADEKKMAADSDYQDWYTKLKKSRKLVSESLYEEQKSS